MSFVRLILPVQMTIPAWSHVTMLTATVTLRMCSCHSKDLHRSLADVRFSRRQEGQIIWGVSETFHIVKPSQTLRDPNIYPSSSCPILSNSSKIGPGLSLVKLHLQLQAREQTPSNQHTQCWVRRGTHKTQCCGRMEVGNIYLCFQSLCSLGSQIRQR